MKFRNYTHRNQEHSSIKTIEPNSWIVPFSDFMTIMMIFFLALYALAMSGSKIDNERFLLGLKEAFGGDTTRERKMIAAADTLENSINTRGLQKMVNIEMSAQKIRIVMAAPILFTPGSADVAPEAQPLLDELARILKQLPNKVTVEGHTCNLPVGAGGRYRSNLELSGARAFGVIRYIIEKEELNPERFVALGCGENVPLKPNDSDEHRSMNRRVELTIEK